MRDADDSESLRLRIGIARQQGVDKIIALQIRNANRALSICGTRTLDRGETRTVRIVIAHHASHVGILHAQRTSSPYDRRQIGARVVDHLKAERAEKASRKSLFPERSPMLRKCQLESDTSIYANCLTMLMRLLNCARFLADTEPGQTQISMPHTKAAVHAPPSVMRCRRDASSVCSLTLSTTHVRESERARRSCRPSR